MNEIHKLCECGCGKEITNKDKKFLCGHYIRTPERNLANSKRNTGRKHNPETILKISQNGKGLKRSPEFCLNNSKNKIGKKFSEQHKKNLSLSMKGKSPSDETKLKQSKKMKQHTGWHHSADTKINMSIAAVKRMKKQAEIGKVFMPAIGNNEISIINKIENNININGISNNCKLFSICGKWPDRYYEKYNLCFDILEKHHFKLTGELSDYDKNREVIIASKLGCMIYYIPEKEFLSNPEKEIQRFKDFLTLLDQGSN